MKVKESELIINPDGSIYHLNIRPDQLADTIITVGDPDRVSRVTEFFDTVEVSVRKREFHTQTGFYSGKRISVVSTGIGTDNIDIVLTELDALANIDFQTRQIKKNLKSLKIIRIGTSGSLHAHIPVDSFLVSKGAVGFDSLWHYYKHAPDTREDLIKELCAYLQLNPKKSTPYYVDAGQDLLNLFNDAKIHKGITVTNVGFYGPQGRVLRAQPRDEAIVDRIANFKYKDEQLTNMEMETSGIYAMASILGHQALSTNAIIANRATGKFSANPTKTTKNLIELVLKKIMEEV